jgi:hypothetical protein
MTSFFAQGLLRRFKSRGQCIARSRAEGQPRTTHSAARYWDGSMKEDIFLWYGAVRKFFRARAHLFYFSEEYNDHDALVRLLININIYGFGLILIVLSIFGSIPFIIAHYEQNLTNASLKVDALSAIGAMCTAVAGLLIAPIAIRSYFRAAPETFVDLFNNKVLDATEIKFDWDNGVIRKRLRASWPTYISVVIGLAVAIFSLYQMQGAGSNWKSAGENNEITYAGYVGLCVDFVCFYLIASFVLRVILIYRIFVSLFQERINIRPLSPDGCGGLEPVARLASKLNVVFFLWSVCFFIGFYHGITSIYFEGSAPFVVSLLLYFSSCLIIYFAPLLPAHRAMRSAKREILQEVSECFFVINESMINKIKQGKYDIDDEIRLINNIKHVYDIAYQMPIFPFNASNLKRAMTSVFIPFLYPIAMSIIQKGIDLYSSLNLAD